MKKHIILVTGGAGFIGSHLVAKLKKKGYFPLVLDNLSRGKCETLSCLSPSFLIKESVGNQEVLHSIFNQYHVLAVIHFAALIDVGESVKNPLLYYENNVVETLQLLSCMIKHHVKTFIFSSSAAVYGHPLSSSITEDHPCSPINPYGETKLTIEKMLKDFDQAYGLKSCALRYFNAAGGDPERNIPFCQPRPTNLIPLVLQSLQTGTPVTLHGMDYPTPDGTCIRDYIHIDDLANAHILAMERLLQDPSSKIYNLGNGKGHSIKEVIQSIEKITAIKVKTVEGERRPGDPPILIANSTKAQKELDWRPLYTDLDQMISDAWQARRKGGSHAR